LIGEKIFYTNHSFTQYQKRLKISGCYHTVKA